MHHGTIDAPADLAERLDRLADELHAAGILTDPAWRDAFYAVPRHLFVPRQAWVHRGHAWVELDRDRDPAPWWDAVYASDKAIITQFDDGGPPDRRGAEPSSSCPAPNVQFRMLHALDLDEAMKVLEIGTGTGWNAALLAHRLGDRRVVTVEVDRTVKRHATTALAAAGKRPVTVADDGRHGYPLKAPYDRVIATCTVAQVPYGWVAQTRPGGIILTPWAPPGDPGGGLLARLTVHPDGTASGPFVGTVSFMRLRQQRPAGAPAPLSVLQDTLPPGTATSTTTTDPATALLGADTAFAVRLALGEVSYGTLSGPLGKPTPEPTTMWLADPARASWARIRPAPEPGAPNGRFVVEQYGPRRLWDETEAAHSWWHRAGQPDPLRFGLTVTPHEQLIWLDDPAQPIVRLPNPAQPRFLGHAR
jgi:protein-L-isoaspartate O-methyltransferase